MSAEVEATIRLVETGTTVRRNHRDDTIVAYAISADLWREIRALLRGLDAKVERLERTHTPGEAQERYLEILERMNPSPEVLAVIERIRTEGR